jgi:hypothetical protein
VSIQPTTPSASATVSTFWPSSLTATRMTIAIGNRGSANNPSTMRIITASSLGGASAEVVP